MEVYDTCGLYIVPENKEKNICLAVEDTKFVQISAQVEQDRNKRTKESCTNNWNWWIIPNQQKGVVGIHPLEEASVMEVNCPMMFFPCYR